MKELNNNCSYYHRNRNRPYWHTFYWNIFLHPYTAHDAIFLIIIINLPHMFHVRLFLSPYIFLGMANKMIFGKSHKPNSLVFFLRICHFFRLGRPSWLHSITDYTQMDCTDKVYRRRTQTSRRRRSCLVFIVVYRPTTQARSRGCYRNKIYLTAYFSSNKIKF